MANINIDKDRNKQLTISSPDNTVTVHEGATIDSALNGVNELPGQSGNRINVEGSIVSRGSDFAAVIIQGEGTRLSIADTARLAGDFGLKLHGNNAEVVNRGIIRAEDTAIEIVGEGNHFINRGTIDARGETALRTNMVTSFDFENHGTIRSGDVMDFAVEDLTLTFGGNSVVKFVQSGYIDTHSLSGWTARIVNDGEIINTGDGMINAIDGGEGVEIIRNTGTITGFIWLEGGNDRYDGRGGRILEGVVGGGEGSDRFLLDDRRDSVHESVGEGYDRLTVSFSYKLDATNEIEEIMLAGKGDFRLVGNDMQNYLEGNKGDNRLVGKGGGDAFFGGAGDDVMTGGQGADGFYFREDADREIVTDFKDGEDLLILFPGDEIESVEDLLANHLHQKGDDLFISGDGTTMILRDFDKADLTTADFTS